MENSQFIFDKPYVPDLSGDFSWKAPSNIAIVKYWGKTNPQIPKNTSLSFTLKNSFTETKLSFRPKPYTDDFNVQVYLDESLQPDFVPKIVQFFSKISKYSPFLKAYAFDIYTHNSFPHSSGIASSASSFAALSLCLMSMERLMNPSISDDYFYTKAAFLARLGSGSATRSINNSFVMWGKHPAVKESSDLFGVSVPFSVHPVFADYQDTILLVDKGQKKVSSSVGHDLMNGHPFASKRFSVAQNNIEKLIAILQTGNLSAFIQLMESEALMLHAMMMTANPYFILMKPNTLEIIHKIWAFREKTNLPIGFTLDAGANVHILYPMAHQSEILSFIKSKLVLYCENNQYICDEIGMGATFISN